MNDCHHPPLPADREAELTREQVQSFCNGKIARFKIPHYVWTVDAFPVTVTGKVQKNKLRDLAANLAKGGDDTPTTHAA